MSKSKAPSRSRAPIFARARAIQRTLGTYVAARYLYLRGVSIEAALYLLVENKK